MIDFTVLPVWVDVLLFVAGSGVIFLAGARLSRYADAIADRRKIGRVFIGALLLGGATSLPEIATTVTAASLGNAPLALSNLLGGVVAQFAVLACVDAALLRGALTYLAPKPVLMVGGVLFVLEASLLLVGIASGALFSIANVSLWPFLVFCVYLLSLHLVKNYDGGTRWVPADLPDAPRQDTARSAISSHARSDDDTSSRRLGLAFAANSLLVLVAGWSVSRTADALSVQTGLGGSFLGATLLAVATSLPEISTTASAVRLGAVGMAISGIIGTNALELGLVFVADVFYRDGLILESAGGPAVILIALGIASTCLYLWGLLERRDRTVLRFGVDSFLVLASWLVGLALVYYLD